MWDFSWLVRRSGPEAEFADWGSRLDDAKSRGYNCIRIDAFPHLIAEGPDGRVVSNFTILPQTPDFMWGNHHEVEVQPRVAIVEFMTLARQRGIGIGLSAWYNPDTTSRHLTIASPADLTRVWNETLQFLNTHDLLGNVLWVDLCNEFPLGQWVPAVYHSIFGRPWHPTEAELVMDADWNATTRAALDSYLVGSIVPLKKAFPSGLKFTFSMNPVGALQNWSSKATTY
jgi:hypothetical protein